MKPSLAISLSTLVFALSAPTLAAEADAIARLEQALEAATRFTYGQDAQPLRAIEPIVVAGATDPAQRSAIENRLLTALNGPATRDAKEFFCRQLFVIGTARCVPPLESLLTDPSLAHVARLVLGRLEGPEAPAALLRALGKTAGELQIGIIGTLGDRRDAAATADLIRLLGASDPGVAAAAATALGRIGGDPAASALAAARPDATDRLAFAIDHARLACADSFHASGQTERAEVIYLACYADAQPESLRIAGLRGLLAVGTARATSLLVQAIGGSDRALAVSTIGFARTAPDAETTRALSSLLPALPPDLQALVLHALGGRGDRAGQEAVLAALSSSDSAVRLAAIEALGALGDRSAVSPLLRIAAAGPAAEAAVARASLAQLSPEEVNTALVQALGPGESKSRVEACRALAKRRAVQAIGPLLKLAQDEDRSVRTAAIRALGDLVEKTNLPALVKLLVRPHTPEDGPELETAVQNVFRRMALPEDQASPILTALETAPAEARPALLRLLGLPATAGALNAVRSALQDPSPATREAAVRTLADWPDERPAEELLALAPTLTSPALRAIALRGYVRMAGLAKDPTALYARALETTQRPEDKRLVLSGLGTTGSAQALALVEPCLADNALQAEAGLAIVQIASRLRQHDENRARAALKRVLAEARDPAVRQKALDLLNELDQFLDHILVWVGAGPFKAEGLDTAALLARPFPPEQADAQNVAWKRLTAGVGTWSVTLDEAIGGGDDLVAYARTRVWAPGAQDVRLELGSDDAIRVWLNGETVHSNVVHRGLGPRQDQVKARLREGWNDLVLKIVNRGGGWGCACRIRQPDGSACEGLKFEAQASENK